MQSSLTRFSMSSRIHARTSGPRFSNRRLNCLWWVRRASRMAILLPCSPTDSSSEYSSASPSRSSITCSSSSLSSVA